MRNKKGYSLLELLVVLLMLALIIALVSIAVLSEINKARGSTLTSEARSTYIAAKTVLLETRAAEMGISDDYYMRGLSGVYVDNPAFPAESLLSGRMAALLSPDIILAGEPGYENPSVMFVIENGEIVNMSYRKFIGSRLYTVTIEGGETSVSHEKAVKPAGNG